MFEQLKDIMSSKFQIDPADITADTNLRALELDSLDAVELSLVIEQELGAKVSDTELAAAASLGDIVALVEARSARV
jgi:acyl carrier protein